MRELLLPVSTFHRVFDTVPVQEVVTLPELVAALRRFELRPQLLASIQREIGRARRSVQRAKAGLHAAGRYAPRLKKAAEQARREGMNVEQTLDALGLELEADARKDAKKDLRIWSPTLYRTGADKRGGDNVTHLSCLVLDYDDGTSIDDASEVWSKYFHIVHTTWSHTAEHPRFRVVLPLGHLVLAREWGRVWAWAEEKARRAIDPALKNPSSTYALPAVPNPNWPREAFSRPGALLSPADEGIVDERPEIDLHPMRPTDGGPSILRGEDPSRHYLDHDDARTIHFVDDGWEDDG
ncbi:MAG: hypothetical protein K8H88_03400, partial [Sandaracinaceae bacterium]|nr:hypothetical protein [Sandaracinaceae bacterium]